MEGQTSKHTFIGGIRTSINSQH